MKQWYLNRFVIRLTSLLLALFNVSNNILQLTLIACPVLGYSQNQPLFQFSLYFEDSIGNKDSIFLGYDPMASSQNLNTQFGEILISAPFDSVFEVRAIHGDDSQNLTSKKVIEHMEVSSDACVLPFRTKIVINARYLPVKVTYDSTLFLFGTCKNVVLSPDRNMFFQSEWWNVCAFHCMADTSIYVEDFVIPPPMGLCGNRLYIQNEVEGQGLKLLPGMYFASFYGPGPCNDPTFLAVKDEPVAGFGKLTPNPVREKFSIQMPSEGNFNAYVVDVTGKVLVCPYEITGNRAQFDVSGLSQGIYFVSINSGRSSPVVYKFVKL